MVVTEADGIKPEIARPDCWSYPMSAEGISRHLSVASLTLVRCRLKRVQNGKVFKKKAKYFCAFKILPYICNPETRVRAKFLFSSVG